MHLQSTAAAEAMTMCYSLKNQKKPMFFVDENCHPQNIALARTRGEALGMEIKVGACSSLDLSNGKYCGVMVRTFLLTLLPAHPLIPILPAIHACTLSTLSHNTRNTQTNALPYFHFFFFFIP